jgi:transposase
MQHHKHTAKLLIYPSLPNRFSNTQLHDTVPTPPKPKKNEVLQSCAHVALHLDFCKNLRREWSLYRTALNTPLQKESRMQITHIPISHGIAHTSHEEA